MWIAVLSIHDCVRCHRREHSADSTESVGGYGAGNRKLFNFSCLALGCAGCSLDKTNIAVLFVYAGLSEYFACG